MSKISKKEQFYFIDYLKAMAIMMVIYTHSSNANVWRDNFFITYIINMAVPIFMLITGFNYAYSFFTRNLKKWYELYNIKLILKRFLRITIPFLIVLGIEYLLNTQEIRKHCFWTNFIQGGKGRGNYYFIVMLQILVLYPIIFYIVNKFKRKGLIYIFIINILWEIFATEIHMKNALYRLISLRYIFLVSLGSWLIIYKEKINPMKLLTSFIIGLNFITTFKYNLKIVSYPFTHWLHSCVLYAFYIFPIFTYIYYNSEKIIINNYFGNMLILIGKSSWHIFLAQMFFYAQFAKFQKMHTSLLYALSYVIICVIVGVIFYLLEKNIKKLCG